MKISLTMRTHLRIVGTEGVDISTGALIPVTRKRLKFCGITTETATRITLTPLGLSMLAVVTQVKMGRVPRNGEGVKSILVYPTKAMHQQLRALQVERGITLSLLLIELLAKGIARVRTHTWDPPERGSGKRVGVNFYPTKSQREQLIALSGGEPLAQFCMRLIALGIQK